MSASRRTLLTGAAAALAGGAAVNLAALAAAKALDDPIFAAIQAYKEGFDFHGECLEKADGRENPNDLVANELRAIGSSAEMDALEAMLGTVPTTVAGALALTTLILDESEAERREMTTLGDQFNCPDFVRPFLRSMKACLAGVQS